MLLRALAVVSGIILVAAAAYASLAHADAGLTSPYGVITVAVAGGLIAGALCSAQHVQQAVALPRLQSPWGC